MIYNLIDQLNEIVNKIETRKPYYENIEDWQHEMLELLLINEKETVMLLVKCDIVSSRIIFWISPYFDEIACKFYSNEMSDAMKSLIQKYPKNDVLQRNVQIAVSIMHNIQNDSSLR